MAFESLNAFLNMGGYAPYVWPAWGVTLAVLVGGGLQAVIEHRRRLRELRRRQRRAAADAAPREAVPTEGRPTRFP
ncbi:heme exporter protein CcmD [Modicisalibacter tunisiensis]|uniref:heme exporter protein CcmD n=1 Tax=Modicisalibacter tunisiensis TaxID=390637 RepID=UPI000798C0CA|nr:heme exporter protein CcmD [Modicisalibacter tunisiensis]KXS38951.1 MAG: heme exporter protein D [Halomonadaceae bacterium T82-2]MBZ9540190.1 heme exporter protein CcmD [Modicisalibacter tunisiensis]